MLEARSRMLEARSRESKDYDNDHNDDDDDKISLIHAVNYSRDEESIVVVMIWVDIGSSVSDPVVQCGWRIGGHNRDQIGTLPNFNSNQDHVNVNKLIELEDMEENMIAEKMHLNWITSALLGITWRGFLCPSTGQQCRLPDIVHCMYISY